MAEEQVADPLTDWSEEDKNWLKQRVPDTLHTTAIRWGAKIFRLVMAAGASTHALGVLARQNRGNRACTQAILVLQQTMSALAERAIVGSSCTLEDFAACKKEVELTLALLDAGQRKEGDRVSKGGIILNG